MITWVPDRRRSPLNTPDQRLRVLRRCRRPDFKSVVRIGWAIVFAFFPGICDGALSISSGYESFLSRIRHRIVCDEDDVFDEVQQKGRAVSCDSMKDGPFCRGLPLAYSSPNLEEKRHRPFTVDSIVPQHLFGTEGNTGDGSENQAVKLATKTLNYYLESHWKWNHRKHQVAQTAAEGRLRLELMPKPVMSSSLDPFYAYGFPSDVYVFWNGGFQTESVPAPISSFPRGATRKSWIAWRGEQRSGDVPDTHTAVRVNDILSSIRFSRPVVIRRLLVHPPVGVESDVYELFVTGWKGDKEMWRNRYRYDAARGPQLRPVCEIGDAVIGVWAGDGRKDIATLLRKHRKFATVRWHDGDHSHRTVQWKFMTTTAGIPCGDLDESGAGDAPHSLWRDLSRKLKSVDEVTFAVRSGQPGWLLSDITVASIPLKYMKTEEEPEASSKKKQSQKTTSSPRDPSSHVVQVYPGPRTEIVEVSQAAVLYHADDMLERGLRIRGAGVQPHVARKSAFQENVAREPGSSALVLHPSRSVEGISQLFRALVEGRLDFPSRQSGSTIVTEFSNLLRSMDPDEMKDAIIKRYGHFEACFAHQWDWLVKKPALEIVYDRWRTHPATIAEAAGTIYEGQVWMGSYMCTQGHSGLMINVTKARTLPDGRVDVGAELTFTTRDESDSKDESKRETKATQGRYEVTGHLNPVGREFTLTPVPGSWKNKPARFVMVGLQGVVSRTGRTGPEDVRYAGSVSILGCDNFVLRSEAPLTEHWNPVRVDFEQDRKAEVEDWRQPVMRMRNAVESLRGRWWEKLAKILDQPQVKKVFSTTVSGLSSERLSEMAQQLVDVVRRAGLVNIEISDAENSDILYALSEEAEEDP